MGRIAVLIPVYNQSEDLFRTMDSVDDQTADLEFVVVDDGSIQPLSIPDHRFNHPVQLIRLQENRGCTEARNIGLRQIMKNGYDYVALQDAGDTDIGERMAMQAEYLDQNPGIAVVGGWAQYTDTEGTPLYVHRAPATARDIRSRMPYVSAFSNPASMIRLSALEVVGLYDTRYPIASDYEIFFRLTRSFETANLQQVLINKVEHPNSLSVSRRRQSLWYRLRAQMKHFSYTSLHSYLGILSTLTLMLLPYRFVSSAKRWRGYAN